MPDITNMIPDVALPIAISLYAALSVVNCLIIRFGWERHVVKVDFVKHNALLAAFAPDLHHRSPILETDLKSVASKSE